MIALLVSNFLGSFAVFLALPVLPLILQQKLGLTAAAVGLICAVWPLAVFLSSWFVGSVIERVGYRLSLAAGLGLCATGYLVAAVSAEVWHFGAALSLFGVGKAIFDAAMRASISAIHAAEDRPRAYRLRYVVLNVATVLAPLIGAWVFATRPGWILPLTSAIYSLGALVCILALRGAGLERAADVVRRSLSDHGLLVNDRGLQLWIASTVLVLLVYGGFETLMPLVADKAHHAVPILGPLMSINAAVVILLQLVPVGTRTYQKEILLAKAGFGLLILGFALFAILHSSLYGLILGTVVFSSGEAMLFPCFDTLMDRLAPAGNKASYFAVGEVKQLGFLLGPVLGGMLIDWSGASLMFMVLSACCMASGMFFAACENRIRLKAV
jgi:MFS family permease